MAITEGYVKELMSQLLSLSGHTRRMYIVVFVFILSLSHTINRYLLCLEILKYFVNCFIKHGLVCITSKNLTTFIVYNELNIDETKK